VRNRLEAANGRNGADPGFKGFLLPVGRRNDNKGKDTICPQIFTRNQKRKSKIKTAARPWSRRKREVGMYDIIIPVILFFAGLALFIYGLTCDRTDISGRKEDCKNAGRKAR
jgi:hypothetical protein